MCDYQPPQNYTTHHGCRTKPPPSKDYATSVHKKGVMSWTHAVLLNSIFS
jgi:hypothetical protein